MALSQEQLRLYLLRDFPVRREFLSPKRREQKRSQILQSFAGELILKVFVKKVGERPVRRQLSKVSTNSITAFEICKVDGLIDVEWNRVKIWLVLGTDEWNGFLLDFAECSTVRIVELKTKSYWLVEIGPAHQWLSLWHFNLSSTPYTQKTIKTALQPCPHSQPQPRCSHPSSHSR